VGELDLVRLPGTMTRVEYPNPEPGRYQLQLMSTPNDCQQLINEGVLENLKDCLPRVEAGNGNVRIAYRILDGGLPLALPIQADPATGRIDAHRYISVMHQTEGVRDGWADESAEAVTRRVSITPHGESLEAAQLFVLLIDRSDSMNNVDEGGKNRLERVKQALMSRSVTERFFSSDKNRVLVLSFAQNVSAMGRSGQKFELIDSPGRYQQVIRGLRADGNWTHLYDAVGYAATGALERPEVEEYLRDEKALPTVIALTDGFDNQDNKEACGDNAAPLAKLLSNLRRKRSAASAEVLAPVVYTVGLGTPALPEFPFIASGLEGEEAKRARREKMIKRPTPEGLCGAAASTVIDPPRGKPGLEDQGIDNASLEWIAFRGGGRSVVTTDLQDLITAFQSAAAKRYEWFELRYHTDPTYFKQSFEVALKTEAFVSTRSKVRFHPPTAFSFPEPSVSEAGWWSDRAPFRSTTALVLPFLGICISLAFLGAAIFNLRRALTREQPRSSHPPQ